MKHKFYSKRLAWLVAALVIIFAACQKEYSFEGGASPVVSTGNANGSITKTNGICLPVQINGIYKKDTAVNSLNSLVVTVDFTTAGTYTIYSDTIDGFYFRTTGTATASGSQLVTLSAFGTPTIVGFKNFKFFFNQSTCTATVPVIDGTVVNNNALFDFAGAPGACASPVIGSAPFVAGTPLGVNNTVILNVLVTRVGTYAVSVGPVNGMTFSIAGVFTNLGPNTIFLVGSGTPTNAGVANFPISSNATNCNFSITVTPGTSPPPTNNTDYIPSTTNSNWTNRVEIVGQMVDTSYVQVNANNRILGGNSYRIFETKDMGVPQDSSYIRKVGTRYYQFIDEDFDVLPMPINRELLILDTALAVNATWTESLGTVIFNGIPVAISVDARIVAKNSSANIQGIIYNSNIISVAYTYKANVPLTGSIDLATEARLYARGIGIVRSEINNLLNPGTVIAETTRSQIN